MKEIKRLTLRLFLATELVVVTFFYLCGRGGLHALKQADSINKELLSETKKSQTEIEVLERELEEHTLNPFYKESIARRELQMAYENETIYVLPKDHHV
jgi:cell division protein FtsB